MTARLMTHVVAGYPSEKECIDLMLGMQKAGVGIIEVQIPFSDPIADGETIMRANDKALENGMTIKKSFELINQAKKRGLTTDVYIMTYFQKVFFYGLDKFCTIAAKAGVKGLIVPDLPFDAPEFEDLYKIMKSNNLMIVPVVSPATSPDRLKVELGNAGDLIYLTSMRGITGKKLVLTKELTDIAGQIKKLRPDSKLAIGFGIESKDDADEILKIADEAVVGSAVIRALNTGGVVGALKLVSRLV